MILDETQENRDQELSNLTGASLQQIQKYKIAASENIMIFQGAAIPKTKQEMERLYKSYKNLEIIGYLRTLMYTSIYGRHKELIQLIRKTKNKVCLDFGSGVGTHSIALAENGNEVHVLDVPGPLLDFTILRLKHRNLKYTSYNNNDKLPSQTFDFVICTDVLEHVFDPLAELKRIWDSMKNNGVLHLQVSTMRKDSSGHFTPSIDRWIQEGPAFLQKHFKKTGNTIYVKTR